MGLALLRMFVFLYSRIPEKKLYETHVATLPSSCENVLLYKRVYLFEICQEKQCALKCPYKVQIRPLQKRNRIREPVCGV